MSLRELRVLVENLPPDSAYVRRMRGHNWGDAEYLLADIADHLQMLSYMYQRVNAKQNTAPPPMPKPTARPGFDPDKDERLRAERLAVDRSHILSQLLPRKE